MSRLAAPLELTSSALGIEPGELKVRGSRRTVVTVRRRVLAILILAVLAALAACGGQNPDVRASGKGDVPQTEDIPPASSAATPADPIGGGIASGTGTDAELVCPEGVEQDTEEWFGPAGLTRQAAVTEAFGDLVVGWIGEPFEISSTETWSSWGLRDDAGNLVAVATVVPTGDGWDPSHARYCVIRQPTAPSSPFTLYVSNQSIEDPSVGITITIDGEVIVDEDFDVKGQHNWVSFEPEVGPGDHTLHAVSSTGAEFTTEFTIPEGEPRWVVVDHWSYPGKGRQEFTFHISDEPIGFA